MIDLDRVFMIEANERLDFENIAAVYSSGFSRIPVYEDVRENIIG
jgi:CBS domain containing-hemolysin-like protein